MKRNLQDIQKVLRAHKKEIQNRYNVKEIGIFGSFARGEESKTSDLDILVEFNKKPDIFILIDLEDYLNDLIHEKVDLVRRSAIREELRESVAKEVMYI